MARGATMGSLCIKFTDEGVLLFGCMIVMWTSIINSMLNMGFRVTMFVLKTLGPFHVEVQVIL